MTSRDQRKGPGTGSGDKRVEIKGLPKNSVTGRDQRKGPGTGSGDKRVVIKGLPKNSVTGRVHG